jgi:hypothetical protein
MDRPEVQRDPSTSQVTQSQKMETTVDPDAVPRPKLVQVLTWGLERELPRTKRQMICRLSCRYLLQGQLSLQSGMQLQCQ